MRDVVKLGLKSYKNKITTKIQKTTEITHHRRALRGHTDQLGKGATKYLETRDIVSRLKAVLERENDVGDAGALHFDILQAPGKELQYLNI